MRRFAQGQVSVLVSTVIVEVGLDVPNATMMVIEHAERFGLAQLHQLRGRIGRGAHPSSCVVFSETQEDIAVQRLREFVETTDGFRLAEVDLQLRGPGELLGRGQHGWIRLRAADLLRDSEVLERARAEAIRWIEDDPDLTSPASIPLRAALTAAARRTTAA